MQDIEFNVDYNEFEPHLGVYLKVFSGCDEGTFKVKQGEINNRITLIFLQ